MKIYNDLTSGLQSILLQATRGYSHCVSFEIERAKLPALTAKWIDNYGVNLPAWKRFERKSNGLPNAWAAILPVPGAPHQARVVLLRTDADLSKLPPESPWHRENWASRIEVGDYVVSTDQRDRRDFTTTIKLTPRCISGLEAHWRSLANVCLNQLVHEISHAVRFYPLFGGVRRQLRRQIRGYAKLWAKRMPGRPWPGPDPESLPTMHGFRAANSE